MSYDFSIANSALDNKVCRCRSRAKSGGSLRQYEPRGTTRRRPIRPTCVQRHRWSLIRILAKASSNRQKNGAGGMLYTLPLLVDNLLRLFTKNTCSTLKVYHRECYKVEVPLGGSSTELVGNFWQKCVTNVCNCGYFYVFH